MAAFLCANAWVAHAETGCRPAAVIDGDSPEAAAVRERLMAVGVGPKTTEGCPAISVRVEKDSTHLVIAIADAYGRTSRRRVRDVKTAAVVVESWIQQEIFLPHVAADSPPVQAPPQPSLSGAPVTTATIAAAPRVHRLSMALGLESAVGTDGSLWLGAGASGCARVGPVCVGVTVRALADTATEGDASQAINRLGGDAVATVELPVAIGKFVVTPGVNAGPGWVRRREKNFHAVPQPQTDIVTADYGRLRLGAQLGFRVAVGREFSLRAVLAYDYGLYSGAQDPTGFARVQFALGYQVN